MGQACLYHNFTIVRQTLSCYKGVSEQQYCFCVVESLLSELDNAVSSSRQQPNEPEPAVQDIPPPNKASSATKELDDLMASLSDFKVNVQTVGPAQPVKQSDDYAKPQKATSSNKPMQGKCLVYFVSSCKVWTVSCYKGKLFGLTPDFALLKTYFRIVSLLH